MLMIFPIG